MILAVVALFSVVLCLVALRAPSYGLGLAAAADLILMEGVPVGGTTIAVESFFFLYLIAIPFLGQLISQRTRLPLDEARPYLKFLSIFFVACIASAVLGGMAGNSAAILSRLPLWGLFGLSSVWLCRTERDIVRVVLCVIAGCAFLLVMAVLSGLPSPEEQGGLMRNRYLNPLGHALSLAAVLCFALWASRAVPRSMRVTVAGLGILFTLGILWSGSRGSLFSLILGVATIAWVVSPGRAKSFGKLAALGGSMLLLFALGTGHVSAAWSGFLANDASSNLYRYQIVVLAGRLFVENPLLGVGLGGMEGAGIFQSSDLRTLAVTIITSDNDYARVLAELGAVGVAIVSGWALFLGRRYRDAIREVRSFGQRQPAALAIGAGIGTNMMVLGLFESVLFSPTGWFYIGLTWACVRVKR
ncbi:MAG: hypothetical protein P1V81_15810 [Planctomycetota bacterium]|nr:hypothetical protein [Planctomycetota bacterium]